MNVENEGPPINPDYYSDENVEKAFGEARKYLEDTFQDTLHSAEIFKLHHIIRDIQAKRTMASEDTWARPMWTEAVYRFIESCYGEDIGLTWDIAGNGVVAEQHLRNKRQEYLDGHM